MTYSSGGFMESEAVEPEPTNCEECGAPLDEDGWCTNGCDDEGEDEDEDEDQEEFLGDYADEEMR